MNIGRPSASLSTIRHFTTALHAMDLRSPSTLAETIEDLAWITKRITANLLRYAGDSVTKSEDDLIREMLLLCDFFESLKLLTLSDHYSSSSATSESLQWSIDQLGKILNEMLSVVDQRGSGRSTWPFSKADNQYFLRKIHQSKETFARVSNVNWGYLVNSGI